MLFRSESELPLELIDQVGTCMEVDYDRSSRSSAYLTIAENTPLASNLPLPSRMSDVLNISAETLQRRRDKMHDTLWSRDLRDVTVARGHYRDVLARACSENFTGMLFVPVLCRHLDNIISLN